MGKTYNYVEYLNMLVVNYKSLLTITHHFAHLVLKMSSQKVQVSPVLELNYISPEDNKDYFILDKTWYAVNGYIKWCGINPWKRQVDKNGKSTLQMIKPLQFWLHFIIVFLIMQASQWGLIFYVLIFYGAWDEIMKIDSYISESKMDSATGYFGVMVVFVLYCPFVFKLRKFGEGIVQAQEHFKWCTKKSKKTNGKISICIGMYDFFTFACRLGISIIISNI